MKSLIQCRHIHKIYSVGKTSLTALKAINLEINTGEYVAILGPSGSGKSTLMHILGCLDKPSSGHYILDSSSVNNLSDTELARVRNRKIGFVFQDFNLLDHATTLENVMLPLFYSDVRARQRRQRAIAILERVGLSQRLFHRPNELSGGQKQRVAIARAMVTEPKVLLADEPTGNLDSKTAAVIIELFASLVKEGKTVIMVTHDSALAKCTQRIIHLKDGEILTDTLCG